MPGRYHRVRYQVPSSVSKGNLIKQESLFLICWRRENPRDVVLELKIEKLQILTNNVGLIQGRKLKQASAEATLLRFSNKNSWFYEVRLKVEDNINTEIKIDWFDITFKIEIIDKINPFQFVLDKLD